MMRLTETNLGTATWLLLIYTIPAEPSRMRATIWRELKRIGAIPMRDGVWTLPERASTRVVFRTTAAKVEEFGGEATLVERACLDSARAKTIMLASQTARTAEYEELAHEVEQFLMHVQRESEHRNFNLAELREIEQDLGKVRHWAEQVQARDYFSAEGRERVEALLGQCEAALLSFRHETASQEDGAQ